MPIHSLRRNKNERLHCSSHQRQGAVLRITNYYSTEIRYSFVVLSTIKRKIRPLFSSFSYSRTLTSLSTLMVINRYGNLLAINKLSHNCQYLHSDLNPIDQNSCSGNLQVVKYWYIIVLSSSAGNLIVSHCCRVKAVIDTCEQQKRRRKWIANLKENSDTFPTTEIKLWWQCYRNGNRFKLDLVSTSLSFGRPVYKRIQNLFTITEIAEDVL